MMESKGFRIQTLPLPLTAMWLWEGMSPFRAYLLICKAHGLGPNPFRVLLSRTLVDHTKPANCMKNHSAGSPPAPSTAHPQGSPLPSRQAEPPASADLGNNVLPSLIKF